MIYSRLSAAGSGCRIPAPVPLEPYGSRVPNTLTSQNPLKPKFRGRSFHALG